MKLKILPLSVKNYVNGKIHTLPIKQGHQILPLSYAKPYTAVEAQNYAVKNFHIYNLNAEDMSEYNTVNEICTKIHNLTNGQAKFPKTINIIHYFGTIKYDGECFDNEITVVKSPNYISTLIHELGHFNHERISSNYEKMGKPSEIDNEMICPDYSVYNKFNKDSKNKKLIRSFLGSYAISSPSEFVAEMFRAIINGKKLPVKLFEAYREYEGPFSDIFMKKYKQSGMISKV